MAALLVSPGAVPAAAVWSGVDWYTSLPCSYTTRPSLAVSTAVPFGFQTVLADVFGAGITRSGSLALLDASSTAGPGETTSGVTGIAARASSGAAGSWACT